MTYAHDIPVCEPLDEFGWDFDEVRDLVQTTPLRYDDGMPVGYLAEDLFGLEGANLGSRC